MRSATLLRASILVLTVVNAGWMVFDAAQSFVTGDYVTPTEGPEAGQLGPWAALVGALGVDPRSAAMRVFFIVFGGAWLAAALGFALRARWARSALLAFAVASLWYLVIGTLISLVLVVLLTRPAVSGGHRNDARSDRPTTCAKP